MHGINFITNLIITETIAWIFGCVDNPDGIDNPDATVLVVAICDAGTLPQVFGVPSLAVPLVQGLPVPSRLEGVRVLSGKLSRIPLASHPCTYL